jgi:hypothetical protein
MPCHNTNHSLLYLSCYSNSSLLVYLDKRFYVYKKEKVRARPDDKQQQNCSNTFERWKKRSHTNYILPYRTQRMRPLLVDDFEHVLYYMSRMWEHDNQTTTFDTFQRGTNIDMSISCKYCGNPIVYDDNIRSKTGKKAPLNEWDNKYNDCPKSHFKRRQELQGSTKFVKESKNTELQTVIDSPGGQSDSNSKLGHYSTNLDRKITPEQQLYVDTIGPTIVEILSLVQEIHEKLFPEAERV